MNRKASIKETGEDVSDETWKRFEDAVGVERDRNSDDDPKTDKPYRDEVERPDEAGGGEPRPDDKGDPKREKDAVKTTTRTE